MSFFRDKKYVLEAVEHLEKRDISDEACRYLLSHIELKLRVLIKDSLKFTKKFKRSNLTKNDVVNVLKDQNCKYKLLNSEFQTKYEKEEDSYKLNNEVLNIKDEMKNVISNNFPKKEKINLKFDWLVVDSKEIKEDIEDTKINEEKEEIVEKKENFENKFFFKDVTDNILTKEANEFFENFKKIIKDQMKKYDNYNNEVDLSKFNSSLNVLKNISKLQVVIPFIIHYLFEIHDKVEINGFKKKNLIIIILNTLFNNPYISLEPYLHIIIKIVLKFMISKKLSLKLSQSEYNFRVNSAKLLSVILLDYSSKYPELKLNMFELINKNFSLILENNNLDESDYCIINGFFNFYYHMNSYEIQDNLIKVIEIIKSYKKDIILKSQGFILCVIKIFNNNNLKKLNSIQKYLFDYIYPYLIGLNMKERLYSSNYYLDDDKQQNEYLLYNL